MARAAQAYRAQIAGHALARKAGLNGVVFSVQPVTVEADERADAVGTPEDQGASGASVNTPQPSAGGAPSPTANPQPKAEPTPTGNRTETNTDAPTTAAGDLTGVSVELDYSSFEDAVGGDYGDRLRLVALPDCVLTTPEKAACRTRTPLETRNDTTAKTLTADAPARTTTFAAVASAGSVEGTYTATSLKPSGTWTSSGGTGNFSWSYAVPVPPAAAGSTATPSVAISYSSAVIDGITSQTNSQTSTFGEGWDYQPGFIERSFKPCYGDEDVEESRWSNDLCWEGDVVTLSLGDKNTPLVHDDDGGWHLLEDDGSRIQHRTTGDNSDNADNNGEHWVITTTDGTQYFFGKNLLDGAPTGAEKTNSVNTVPVFGNHAGEPCYDADSLAGSRCQQAWRWNLDFVRDPHGNTSAYYYQKEANQYSAANGDVEVQYTRASHLARIDYGMHDAGAGSIYNRPAPQQILFHTTNRCASDESFDCGSAELTSANAAHWPDVPQDQDCSNVLGFCGNLSPTFWTSVRTIQITTQYRTNSGGYQPVDVIDLEQSFPGGLDRSLSLDSITRTGITAGNQVTMPPITFHSVIKNNRVPRGSDDIAPKVSRRRLSQIDTDTGSTISIYYNDDVGQSGRAKPLCTYATLPTSGGGNLAHNTTECFPVKYEDPDDWEQTKLDYFHKYVVTQVDEAVRNAMSPNRTTTYTYTGNPAWHRDDNEVVFKRLQSYGQFRGYPTVETRTGSSAQWTLSKTSYFQGMDGDFLLDGSLRDVTRTDTSGGEYIDHDRFAGRAYECKPSSRHGKPTGNDHHPSVGDRSDRDPGSAGHAEPAGRHGPDLEREDADDSGSGRHHEQRDSQQFRRPRAVGAGQSGRHQRRQQVHPDQLCGRRGGRLLDAGLRLRSDDRCAGLPGPRHQADILGDQVRLEVLLRRCSLWGTHERGRSDQDRSGQRRHRRGPALRHHHLQL